MLGGDAGGSRIDADVFLLTDRAPALLPKPGTPLGFGLIPLRSEQASPQLLADLRSDKGMEWMPERMWFTAFRVGEQAARLHYDLAVDASGRGRPSLVAAGLRRPAPPVPPTTLRTTTVPGAGDNGGPHGGHRHGRGGPRPPARAAPRRSTYRSRRPTRIDLGLAVAGAGALAAAVATGVIGRRRQSTR